MQSIVMFNNKGGVGKTTLLCNLAAYLAQRKRKKILLVDADPQCNATQSVFSEDTINEIYSSKGVFTIYSVIRPLSQGKGFTEKLKPRKSDAFSIDVIPGDPRLALTEDLLSRDWSSGTGGEARGLRTSLLFYHFLSMCKEYDYVFFDVGPSLGSINRSVLIASDFFIAPMSIDIFSLRAVENISISLTKWKSDINHGLQQILDSSDLEEVENYQWRLKLLGYVTQQYTAKSNAVGERRAVKAYDRIMKKIPEAVHTELVLKLQRSTKKNVNYLLGSVPLMHSLVPLSQTSHRPIFALRGKDGVVGAHFAKVKEYEEIIKGIGSQVLLNTKTIK